MKQVFYFHCAVIVCVRIKFKFNLLVFYHKCHSLIGYATHYISVIDFE